MAEPGFKRDCLSEFGLRRCLGHNLPPTRSAPGETKSLCLENPRERPKPCGLQAPGPHTTLSQAPGDRGSHSQRQRRSTSRVVVVTQKSLLQKYCKPKSLSCNYIQNGACFLPSSLKINSRNHAPSAVLFRPLPFPGVRYTRYGNLQAARPS